MNFSIYIPDELAHEMTNKIQGLNITRNHAIREAVEEWLVKHKSLEWPDDFFNFTGIKNIPEFSEYRSELLPPNENVL